MNYKFSIDRISFVGLPQTLASYYASKYAEKYWVNPNGHYQYNFKWDNPEIFFQITHHKNIDKQIRVEFNPNNIEDFTKVIPVFKYIKVPDLTRVDYAIDIYQKDFNDLTIIDDKSRKYHDYRTGKGRLETRYIGTPKSENVIRIYDKAKEQKITSPMDWWRVEAQCRGDSAKELGINPFSCVHFLEPSIKADWDLRKKAMVSYLIEHPEELQGMPHASKSRYKKLLKGSGYNPAFDLASMFEAEKQALIEDIRSWLGLCNQSEF